MIYNYSDIPSYLNSQFAERGRGEAKSLAHHLNVSTSLISQVANGKRTFSIDQVYKVAEYFALNRSEYDYLFYLHLIEKAGYSNLKKHFRMKAKELADEERKTETKFKALSRKQLQNAEALRFYSSWKYSAVKQIISLGGQTPSSISNKLGLAAQEVREIVLFLREANLIKENNGILEVSSANTHISADSPLIKNHHANWRSQAVERSFPKNSNDIFFTGPMTVSESSYLVIEEAVEGLMKLVREEANKNPDDHDTVACINLDLFRLC